MPLICGRAASKQSLLLPYTFHSVATLLIHSIFIFIHSACLSACLFVEILILVACFSSDLNPKDYCYDASGRGDLSRSMRIEGYLFLVHSLRQLRPVELRSSRGDNRHMGHIPGLSFRRILTPAFESGVDSCISLLSMLLERHCLPRKMYVLAKLHTPLEVCLCLFLTLKPDILCRFLMRLLIFIALIPLQSLLLIPKAGT